MPDKLTDKEIVKALECRILTGLRKINKCGKCKYVKSDACNIRGLITDALDLINRQNEQLKANFDSRQTNECENIDVARFEAEINRLQAENDNLKNDELPKCKDALRRANEIGIELQAENENCYKFIEQLKEARNLWEDKCKELQAENERLKAYIQNNGSGWGLISHLEFCKNLKAEAYKDFAERVKNKFHEYRKQYKEVANFDGAAAMLIAKKGVDNLLKELVGDSVADTSDKA